MKATTMPTTINVPSHSQQDQGRSLWYDAYLRIRKDKVSVISFFIICFYLIITLLSSIGIIFENFATVDNTMTYLPPSWQHWFGTDIFGRDVLARAVHGTKTSLTVGFAGTGIAMIIGTVLGATSGYFGGKVDDLIVWFYTTIDTIPYILLVVAFSFVLGPSLETLCLAIGLTAWVQHCRIIRGEYIKHRDLDYVQGAAALGAGHVRRIFKHILPNVFHLVLINFSLGFVGAVKSEVILSFLGLGVEAGTPSWGVMINDAKQELFRGVWWNLAAATVFMFFLVLAFNLFTDGLRDALDPKLKNK